MKDNLKYSKTTDLLTNIMFSYEMKKNLTLNNLDLTISIAHKRHEFNIFRKLFYTDTLIPADSNHPISLKLAVF